MRLGKLDRIPKSTDKAHSPILTSNERSDIRSKTRKQVLEWLHRIKAGEADTFEFSRSLPSRVPVEEHGENAWTQTYRAIFDIAREHPELSQELGEMENIISQNPQMLHPAHLMDIASDVMWDPRIPGYLKTTMIHGLGYALRFMKSTEYEKAVVDKLDFTNEANFSDTAHFLEFMQDLYNIGDQYSYEDDDTEVISRVHTALREAFSKGKGSYLLNVRAQELLAEMDGRSWVSSGFDRVPFLITKDRYARHKEDGLHISSPEDQERIAQMIDEFKTIEAQIRPPQHLVDEAIALGETEVWWTPDQRLMRERETIYGEIDNAFPQKLTYAELAPGNNLQNPDERAVEEHDFAYLQRKPIRETIKKDFEIEISNLSLQDQYKLLRVLKAVEYGKATPLLLEATRALWKAGVKEYLREISDSSLEVHTADFSERDLESILKIQEERYRGKYPEKLEQELRDALSDALKSPYSRFYLYRKNGEIVTYVRFDDLVVSKDVEKKHMASFMTNPRYEGGALGQALLEVALQKEIEKGQPLYAECDPGLVPFYEEFGFRLLRSYRDDHGVDTCDIVLEPASSLVREAA